MTTDLSKINDPEELKKAYETGNTDPIVDTNGTELLAFAGYQEFERAADQTAIKIKEGFMEMGYILKIARDTDILAGSGYRNFEEFAQSRYDLDKGTVSRYIRIVERFSEGGNSHVLKENYRQMGFAKLSLMLHMPDAIAEELMDSLSKSEVLAIKEEIEAEEQVSDVELLIEKAEEMETQTEQSAYSVPGEEDDLLVRAVYQMAKDNQDIYRKVWNAVAAADFRLIPDILAPQGDAVIMVRIAGTGRIMIAIQGESVSVTVVRTQEKAKYTMMDTTKAITALCPITEDTPETAYQLVFGVEMEKEPEPVKPTESKVAPVQPAKEKRKDSKVTKAKTAKKEEKKKPEPKAPEIVEAEPTEEQIPGQDTILNHPEYLPEEMREKESEDAANTEPGAAGNINDMPAGTDRSGVAEQSGASAGMDRESENVQEPEKDAGTDEDGNVPYSVITQCETNLDMTDEDYIALWADIIASASKIQQFLRIFTDQEMVEKRILKSSMEEAYKEAINVAAGLEKIINGQKYLA